MNVNWQINESDIWKFTDNNSKNLSHNSILLRFSNNYEKEEIENYSIIFELIIYKVLNNNLIEISSGWSATDLVANQKKEKKNLFIEGGSPFSPLNADSNNFLARRKGFKNFFKNLTMKNYRARLEIEILPINQINENISSQCENLPHFILVKKNYLNICSVFRQYLGTLNFIIN